MKNIQWIEGNRIQIVPPKQTKKITGTRFATILGLNPWSTPFEMWCAITKTYEKPFDDTIYTIAGKTIEPKQAEFMRQSYLMNLITPTDRYGEDYFHKTRGDFFPDSQHLGGMWDYLGVNELNEVDTVLEMKTTKRVEDWQFDIPEYYALQAALYAYLLGIDRVVMVASFLEESDYQDPSQFEPKIGNTIAIEFYVSQRYPDFLQKVATVEQWWKDHVETGISPAYDEKKDAEILQALRTNSLSPDTSIQDLVIEAEGLKKELDAVQLSIRDKEKRLKTVTERIKEHAQSQFRDGDKKVEVKGSTYTWTVSRSMSVSVDKDALARDGLLDKYCKQTETYRISVK